MDTEALISVISRKPALWMTKHPEHKYRSVTNALWEEIKQEFPDSEVPSLRKKWKYLKYTYRRQLKKSQPSWKYFESMGFLRDQYEDEETDPLSVDQVNGDSAETAEASSPVIVSSSPVPSPTHLSINTEGDHQNADSLRSFRKQSKDNGTEAATEAATALIKKRKFEAVEKQFSIEDITKSDDYYFLMSLLPQIVRLPPIKKLRLRNKFHQVLLDELSACYGKP